MNATWPKPSPWRNQKVDTYRARFIARPVIGVGTAVLAQGAWIIGSYFRDFNPWIKQKGMDNSINHTSNNG